MNDLLCSGSLFRNHLVRALRLGFVAGLLGGCAPVSDSIYDPGDDPGDDSAGDASALGRTRYVPIEDVLDREELATWAQVRTGLDNAFDDVCGDTFCGGDWSNLEPLDLSCSASTKRRQIRECVWTFGASQELVDAGGSIAASIPIFTCRFAPKGAAHHLVRALAAGDPLRALLPYSDESLYDVIGGCFGSPIGAEPLPEDSALGPYVDASDGLDENTVGAWYTMTGGLRSAYDESVAGETGVPHPLRLRCSEDENTRKLGTCTWVFAGAATAIKSSGLHSVRAKRAACSFHVDATAVELASSLAPEGEVGPLDRLLPGRDVTLRDELDACL